MCIYIGVIPFCMRWGWLAKRAERAQAAKEEKDERERALLPPEADSQPRQIAEVEGASSMQHHELDPPQVCEADSAAAAEVNSVRVVANVMPLIELVSTELTR
jgi:hypothetical protein